MPVKVKCPSCEKVLNAPDKARGRAVKCPNCKNPVRIPAAKKKKPAAEAGGFDDDFLSDLDLGKVEDHSARVCPRCGAQADDDDLECPACGADLATGQRASKKAKSKVNKKKYFKSAWSDAWSFVFNHKSYVVRTSIYIVIFSLLFSGSMFMVGWCSRTPPKVFWGFVALIFWLVPIGWPWFLTMETIKLTLAGKKQLKHVDFNMFDCVALGIKFYAWTFFFGLPIWAVFGIPASLMIRGGNALLGGLLIGTGDLLILSMLPVAMAHMAMPIPTPGWLIHRVMRGWSRSFGACFFVLLMIFGVSLISIGAFAVAGFMMSATIVAALQGGAVTATAAAFTVPIILLAVGILFSSLPIVFGARAFAFFVASYKPVLDLNPLEKQVKYVKKKEKLDEAGNPIDSSKTPAWLKWTAGTTGTIILYVVVNVITYNFFDGLLILPRPIARILRLVND